MERASSPISGTVETYWSPEWLAPSKYTTSSGNSANCPVSSST
jgi:hypothetical protein